MKNVGYNFFLLLFLHCGLLAAGQQNSFTFGLNSTYFRDWKKLSFNIYNPEVSYSGFLSDKYRADYTLNVFYGENLSSFNKKEAVIDRLVFSNDFSLDYLIDNFFVSAGPTFRYRHEKKIVHFSSQSNPFEVLILQKEARFDVGGTVKTGYNVNINKKSFIALKLAYRFYARGVNPVSFGVSYGLSWN